MKKRLTCLLLCLVMLLSLGLTACSKKSEEEAAQDISTDASASAKTLTMWIVSENEVSADTAKLVTEELNKITKSKFKTQLIVKFLTEDVYEETLSTTIENYLKAKENGGVAEEDAEVEETEKLDNGMTIIKYPDPVPYQVDIVYIAGEKMFLDYVNNGWLYALDDQLNGSAKKIKEYVSDTLLSAAKLEGTTYAVPNNNVIGEYTYMLLNKELMNKYSQQGYVTLGKIDGFFNTYLFNYLKQIHLFEKDVIPVNASYEDCLNLLAHYWSVDPYDYSLLEDFSVFGSHYTDVASLSRGSVILGYDSLFANPEFTADYLKLNELKFDGYFNEEKGKTAAVKFVKGDSTVLEEYEDEYYSVIVEYPTASADDIYSHMFGVCTYTRSLSRSMDIITYLNTNTEFRNILQYGVENKHYRMNVDEDTGKTTLERLGNEYMMNIYATGNAFVAYPEPDMSEDIWEKGKIQNRGSLVNPLLGFNIKDFAATTGAAAAELKLEKNEDYKLSYSTGYSKDVLTQDEDLAKWIAECDDAGKGIYVLKTSTVSGQNVNNNFYVYNTLVSKDAGFEVNVVPYYATVEDGENEKEVLESLDFVLNYTNEGDADGYQLSLVSIFTKKTTPFNVVAQLNESELETVQTDLSKLITFDFLNTKEYSIDLYADLTKAAVLKNTGLMTWLQECDKAADSKSSTMTFVKNYVDEATGETTYIVYQTGMRYITTVDFVPTGDLGELNLNFDFKVIEDRDHQLSLNSKAELDMQDREYILYYVRVKPNAGVKLDINCNVTKNGSKLSVTKETAKEDPDFVICGNMDTELIKYMYQLNKELTDLMNACTNYTDLVAVVEEISVLLSTEISVTDLTAYKFVKLKDTIKNGVIKNDLATFHAYLLSATSTEIIKNVDMDGKDLFWKDPISQYGEAYVYFDSLYGIYYQWMNKYGYLPTTK